LNVFETYKHANMLFYFELLPESDMMVNRHVIRRNVFKD